jgi:NADPH:quinone reductase-like Zn-dependent oxidoreductase
MRAAVLHEHGATPRCGDFADPREAEGDLVVQVAAAALHHLDLHKATGTFYTGPPPLPSVVGTDGVGRLGDGRRVYFDATVAPYGSMAERALVPREALFKVAEGVDDATAAALGNTGLGAWLALSWRAGLRPGETVLVLGATGAFGTVAIQAAKVLGAGRVVAGARPSERLAQLLELGADAVVELDGAADLHERLRAAANGEVHVTLDTLWGEPGRAAIGVAARFARHLQVGNLAGLDVTLPATALRSISLDLRGFSVAHPSPDVRREGYLHLTRHVARGDIAVDVEAYSLELVDAAWERQRAASGGPKLVLLPPRKEPSP